jgi:hypothetical protein
MKRIMLLVAVAALVVLAVPVSAGAKPPGVDPGVGKLVFNMNIIGTPGDYEGNCGGGSRVFVERDASNAQLIWRDTATNNWQVLWCDATGNDGPAEVQIGDLGTFDVYIRILGKPGGELSVCADVVSDDVSGDNLCLLGSFTLTRAAGKSQFQLKPDSMFDNALEDVLWEMDTNHDFRIANLRVYESPA